MAEGAFKRETDDESVITDEAEATVVGDGDLPGRHILQNYTCIFGV